MLESWLNLVDRVLRPARPHLDRCLEARELYLEARRLREEKRARDIADCTGRIEVARADVFAAADGVVTARMTDLEREWRRLSRPDPDGGLMDLWDRIAPRTWIDRKLWRDAEPSDRVDVATALSADVEGVEAVEATIDALRSAFIEWGTPFGARIRWRSFEGEFDGIHELLENPLRVAREALSSRDGRTMLLTFAERLERDVREAALARFPDRAVLARTLGRAALVDCLWRATSLATRPNPVAPLRDLWSAGYTLSAADERGVTVEVPPLQRQA